MLKQYLYRVSILSKKTNHPLDSISHYCGQSQYDMINNKTYSSNTGDKVIWNNIITPDKHTQTELFSNLPDYLKFRSQKADIIANSRNVLWKQVDSRETRPNSQFARLFELVIPHFITQEEAINLVTQFSQCLVNEGMIIDCSLHNHNKKAPILSLLEKLKYITPVNKEEDNEYNQDYTAFLTCTLRDYKNGQFGNKNRTWNNKEKMKEWRSIWATCLNNTIIYNQEANSDEKLSWIKELSMYIHNDNDNDLKPKRLQMK